MANPRGRHAFSLLVNLKWQMEICACPGEKNDGFDPQCQVLGHAAHVSGYHGNTLGAVRTPGRHLPVLSARRANRSGHSLPPSSVTTHGLRCSTPAHQVALLQPTRLPRQSPHSDLPTDPGTTHSHPENTAGGIGRCGAGSLLNLFSGAWQPVLDFTAANHFTGSVFDTLQW